MTLSGTQACSPSSALNSRRSSVIPAAGHKADRHQRNVGRTHFTCPCVLGKSSSSIFTFDVLFCFSHNDRAVLLGPLGSRRAIWDSRFALSTLRERLIHSSKSPHLARGARTCRRDLREAAGGGPRPSRCPTWRRAPAGAAWCGRGTPARAAQCAAARRLHAARL